MICPECEEKELRHTITLKDKSEKTQEINIYFRCSFGCGHQFTVTRHLCITPEEVLDGINLE